MGEAFDVSTASATSGVAGRYASALFEVARAEGSLAEMEDELFRFARTFEGSDEG